MSVAHSPLDTILSKQSHGQRGRRRQARADFASSPAAKKNGVAQACGPRRACARRTTCDSHDCEKPASALQPLPRRARECGKRGARWAGRGPG
eukprot:4886241-Alexandrium_andersonii.AAC.1